MGTMICHSRGTQVVRKPIKARCQGTPVTDVLPSGCWANEVCFVIGGGPSLVHFDWSLLDGYKVIGINKAFMQYPVDVNFGIDYRFFETLQYSSDPQNLDYALHRAWQEFHGVKVFVRRSVSEIFAPGVHYVKALERKAISFELAEGIYPGTNSGVGALLFAVGLGCKRIGLLGYDFRVQGNRTHWHDGYTYQTADSLAQKLEGFRRCVDEWAGGLAENKIQVVNLSPDSALQNYPRMDIQTFLEGSTV